MSTFMMVISPAKTLDFETPSTTKLATDFRFQEEAAQLVDLLRTCSAADLRGLMSISSPLAELNVKRFSDWQLPVSEKVAKQAILAFQGDVYSGLDAATLSEDLLQQAQQQLRILSGLYGLLRPLDRMLPYRLEMGTRLVNKRGRNLYQWWGDAITDQLNADISETGATALLNLASQEYFKAVNTRRLNIPVITPEFRDWKNGQYKMISFFAKKARGMMVRFILDQGVNTIDDLKKFDRDGYRYDKARSSSQRICFIRDDPQA